MKNSPLVSVVTPSFNQAKFIVETLRSVKLQEYRPIHQIVIDGGSTDGTVDMLREWERLDHGPGYSFEWISEPDRGHADGLNKGFDRARGAIIGWLNSDDVYFDRQVVSTSVAAFSAHPDVDVVHGDVALISESSGFQMVWCFPTFDYARILRGYLIPQPTVFFRRCVIDQHRLNPTFWGPIDHVYWLQIGREHKFLKLARIQAGDRDHQARISQISKIALAQASRDVCAAYGASDTPTWIANIQDSGWRLLLRARGAVYVLSLLCNRDRGKELAFPLWIDGGLKALARQFTMRIDRRTDMGPRPAKSTQEYCATR